MYSEHMRHRLIKRRIKHPPGILPAALSPEANRTDFTRPGPRTHLAESSKLAIKRMEEFCIAKVQRRNCSQRVHVVLSLWKRERGLVVYEADGINWCLWRTNVMGCGWPDAWDSLVGALIKALGWGKFKVNLSLWIWSDRYTRGSAWTVS